MAVNDIIFYDNGVFGYPGDNLFSVQAQSSLTPYFNPGELAFRALGAGEYVTTLAASTTTKPAVGTDYIAGVTASASNETSANDGVVSVTKFSNASTFLMNPGTAATWNTQAKYNALIGARVLISSSAASNGVVTLTVLASDSANNGLVVMPLDITRYPGKVRVAFRGALNFLA